MVTMVLMMVTVREMDTMKMKITMAMVKTTSAMRSR